MNAWAVLGAALLTRDSLELSQVHHKLTVCDGEVDAEADP